MEIFFHISWRRSFEIEVHCDQSVIVSGDQIGVDGERLCEEGCSGEISNVLFRCTDYSIINRIVQVQERFIFTLGLYSRSESVVCSWQKFVGAFFLALRL